MARRYYSSIAVATTITGNISNSATSITVAALTGYPGTTPFTAVLEPDTVNEEVVEVTNVSGTTLTVTRGVDGTTAVAHNSGSKFQHGVSGRDFDEANDHVNDSTGVHGIASGASVVGTTDTQTLTNKTITFATNTLTGVTPTSRLVSAGNGLTGGGDLTSDITISADFALTTAALGTSGPGNTNTVSRGNHVHAMPSASDVGAVANSLVTAAGQVIASSAASTPVAVAAGTTDGHVLTWDSASTPKMKWAAASGGSAIDPLFFAGV